MKTTSHDHLQSILSQRGSPLQKIFMAYEAHQSLDRNFQRDLPENYKGHVKLLLYKGGVMTLGVRNASLSSRLTYAKEVLLQHFKQQSAWAGLREIHVKITA